MVKKTELGKIEKKIKKAKELLSREELDDTLMQTTSILETIDNLTIPKVLKNEYLFDTLKLQLDTYQLLDNDDAALEICNRLMDLTKEYGSLEQRYEILKEGYNIALNMGDINKMGDYAEAVYDTVLDMDDNQKVIQALIDLGIQKHFSNQYDPAIKYFKKAFKLANKSHNNDKLFAIYSWLGTIYQEKCEYDKANNYYQSAFSLAEDLNNDDYKLQAYDNRINLLIRWGNFEAAEQVSTMARQLAKAFQNKSWLAVTYESYAKVLRGMERYDEALSYFNRSSYILNAKGYKGYLTSWSNQKGLTYRTMGHYEKALELFQEQLNYVEEKKNGPDIALNKFNIGYTYFLMGEKTGVLPAIKKALSIDQKLGDEVSLSYDYRVLGRIYQEKGNFEKSLNYYTKSLEIDEQLDDQEKISEDHMLIAGMFRDSGDMDSSGIYYKKLNKYIAHSPNICLKADYLLLLGRYYTECDAYYLAWDCFKLAMEYYKEIKRYSGLLLCYFYLAELEMQRNSIPEAIRILKLATSIDFTGVETYFKYIISNKESKISREALLEKVERYASFLNDKNESAQAAYFFGWAAALASNIKLSKRYIELKLKQAKTYNDLNEFKESLIIIDEVSPLINSGKSKKLQEKIKYIEKYALLHMENSFEVHTTNRQVFRADVLLKKAGSLFTIYKEYERAAAYLVQASDLAPSISSDNNIQYTIFEELGKVYCSLAKYELSVQNFKHAAQVCQKRKNYEKAIEIYKQILNVFNEIEKQEDKLDILKEMLWCTEQTGSEKEIMDVCNQMAMLFDNLEDYTEAEKFYQKAIALAVKINDKDYKIVLQNNSAYLNYNKGNHENAIALFKSSLRIAKKRKYDHFIASSSEGLHYVYSRIKNEKETKKYHQLCAQTYYNLANSDGHFDDNIYYSEKALSLYDMEIDEDKYADLIYLKAYYLEKQDNNYEALNICESFTTGLNGKSAEKDMARFKRLESKLLAKLGQYSEAVNTRKISLDWSKKQNNVYNIIWDSYYLGESYLNLNEKEKGLKQLYNSLEWADMDDDDNSKAIIYNNIALNLVQQDEPVKALKFFQESLVIVKKRNEPQQVMLRLMNLALLCRDLQKYDLQYDYLKQNLEFALKQEEKDIQSKAYYEMGSYLAGQEKHEEAIELINQALEILTEANYTDNNLKASFYNDLAISYAAIDQNKKSIEFLELAIGNLSNSDDVYLKTLILSNLALRYLEAEDNNMALKYANINIDFQLKFGNEKDLVKAYIQLGHVYKTMNNNEQTEYCFIKATNWAERSLNKEDMFKAYKQLAKYHRKTFQYDECLDDLNTANNITNELSNPQFNIELYYELALVHFEQQNYPVAKEKIMSAYSLIVQYSWQESYPEALQLKEEIENVMGENEMDEEFEQDGNPPATDKDVDNCISDLFDNGFMVPPNDYFEFLKEMNGWSFNGNVLYGTKSAKYTPSLLDRNNGLNHIKWLKNKVVIGNEDEGLFLYNYNKKLYEIVDRMDGMVYEEFNDFQDFREYLEID